MAEEAPNRLPAGLRDVLTQADRFDLFSLEPTAGGTNATGNFYGWPVLGSVAVSGADREALVTVLEAGVAENTGWVAACFNPRHGIRAVRGAVTADLVLCFQCARVEVYENGCRVVEVLVSDSPQPVFDRVLTAAGVPLAKGSRD